MIICVNIIQNIRKLDIMSCRKRQHPVSAKIIEDLRRCCNTFNGIGTSQYFIDHTEKRLFFETFVQDSFQGTDLYDKITLTAADIVCARILLMATFLRKVDLPEALDPVISVPPSAVMLLATGCEISG